MAAKKRSAGIRRPKLRAGGFGPSFSSSDPNPWYRFGGKTDTGLYVNEISSLQLPVVYACVSIISDAIAMLPARVEEYDEVSGKVTRVASHPASALLNQRPNRFMTPFSYRQTGQSHACLWGNHYSQISLDRAGVPISLWPLQPGAVAPQVRNVDGQPQVRYIGTWGGEAIDLDASEVIHIRGMGTDGLCGLSPIALARQAIGLGLAMEKFGAKLFANDLRSGGILEHPGILSAQAEANLRASFSSQAGLENAHTVKVLEEGMTFRPLTIPPEDAQFIASRHMQIAEIARMYRVPLVLLQDKEGGTTWGSGIKELNLGVVRWTLQPWITQWEQESTIKLLSEADRAGANRKPLRVRLDVRDLLRGDTSTRAEYYKIMSEIGALTPEEIRSEEGFGDPEEPLQAANAPRILPATTDPTG